MTSPRVGIITLNWNGYDDTVACVDSLLKLSYSLFHVFVVDNASDHAEADRLQKKFFTEQRVTVIAHTRNDGYAGGNNIGISRALADGWDDYLWLVNNDVIVESSSLQQLLAVASVTPQAGVFGCTILYPDRETVYALGGASLNLWTGIDHLFGARKKIKTISAPRSFGYISGAAFFIRGLVLKKIGVFDPDYFLYSEEADFCLRARQAGYTLAYAPQAIVYHHSAKTTGYLSATYIYYFLRNKLVFMYKRTPIWHWPSWLATFFVYYCLGMSFLLVRSGRAHSIPLIGRAALDGLGRRWGDRLINRVDH